MIHSWTEVIVPVAASTITFYLTIKHSLRKSRKQEVYTPLFNRVQENVNSLDYDEESGDFRLIWDELDGHIKKSVNDNITGPLVMFDGAISELNRFLTNYEVTLKDLSEESDLIRESPEEYSFVVNGQEETIPVAEFVDRFGEIIITSSNKHRLYEGLRREAERGQLYSEISTWSPTGPQVEILWRARKITYQSDPHLMQPPEKEYSDAIDYARKANKALEEKAEY